MSGETVDIALATYNGRNYLQQQLDSLLGQSVKNTRILIGDDGSTDGTLALIDKYVAKYCERVVVLPPELGGRGACENFNRVLLATDAAYVFLCDQDDVWDEDKVRISLERMQELEAGHGKETPILVHTDLRVVDQMLTTISDSFFDFQNLDDQALAFKQLLVQNMVTGCTVVVNRALLNRALPIPADAIMHDWWLALVAAAFGQIGFVGRSTMSYRQHGSNTVGAKGWTFLLMVSRLKQLMSRTGAGDLLRPGVVQAQAFLQRYGSGLSAEQMMVVGGVAEMLNQNGMARVKSAVNLGLRKHGGMRTLGYYWALLTARFK